MRRHIAILIFIFCSYNLAASPQAPDYLIIGQDTLPIYFLPLNRLDTIRLNEFNLRLQQDTINARFSLSLWRGYQAYWRIEDEKLYLVGFKGIPNSEMFLKSIFPDSYKDGKVLAEWFSSYLALPKDKVLKWDGVFSRTYYKEEILEFTNGNLIDRKLVNNYVKMKNGISRLHPKTITNKIFRKIKKLNWKELSDLGCDDKYLITINENGKIGDVEIAPIFDTKKENDEYAEEFKICTEKFKDQLTNMQFDIIKWNGKPYRETIHFEIFYDKKLENWTEYPK